MNKKMMKRALTLAAFGLLMAGGMMNASAIDRKSTRLNSSHPK